MWLTNPQNRPHFVSLRALSSSPGEEGGAHKQDFMMYYISNVF